MPHAPGGLRALARGAAIETDEDKRLTNPQRDLLPANSEELSALLKNVDDIDPGVWPRTLAELVDVYVDHFLRLGRGQAAALTEAQAVVIVLAHHFGGRMVYLPRDDKLRLALRDARIWREHNGRNVQDLADRYGLTAAQIYGILREQRVINRPRS